MLPQSRGLRPSCLHIAEQVELDAGLVAITPGQDHARLVGLVLQDRTAGGVELDVHRHHVLAMTDRSKGRVRPVFDMAGGLDDDLDPAGRDQRQRIGGDGELAGPDGVIDLSARGALDDHVVRDAGDRVGVARGLERPVADGGDAHSGRVAGDLVDDALGHESSAEQPHLQGASLGGPLGQRSINNDHVGIPVERQPAPATPVPRNAARTPLAWTQAGQE
jgi:hypothetical protein